MKVLRKYPNKSWELIEIENSLIALQKEVGGHIETFRFTTDHCLICNKEGLTLGMMPNYF